MTVAEFVGKLGFQVDEASLKKGEAALEKIGKAFLWLSAGAGAATTALGLMVKGLADQASAASDTAQALGIGTAALQELGYAAQLSGSSAEELEGALGFLARNASAAAEGSAEAAQGFAKLGVSVRDARGNVKPADALLVEVSERFRKMPDSMAKTSLAMDLFGKSGKSFIPFLNQGSAGIEALRQEARDLGIVLDDETVKAGEALGDTFDRVGKVLTAVRAVIAGPLLVPVRQLIEDLIGWWKVNREILSQRWNAFLELMAPLAQGVAGAILTAADAFGKLLTDGKALGETIYWLRFAFGALATAGVLAATSTIASAVVFAASWLLAAAPFLLLGLVIAAVADDVYQFATGGESVIGDLVGTIREMGPVLGTIVTVVGALTAGWIAMKIAAVGSMIRTTVLVGSMWLQLAAGAIRNTLLVGSMWAQLAAGAIRSAAQTTAAWVSSSASAASAWLKSASTVRTTPVTTLISGAARTAAAWVASAARKTAAWVASGVVWLASMAVRVAVAIASALATSAAWVASAALSAAAWVASAALTIASMAAAAAAAVVAGAAAAAAWIAATWPVLLLIAIVGALAYQIYQFATGGQSLIGDFIYILEELWISIKDGAAKAWDAATQAVSDAIDGIGGIVGDAIGWYIGLWTSLFDAVLGVWDGIVDSVSGVVTSIREKIGEVIGWVIEKFQSVGTVLKDAILKALDYLPGPVKALLGKVGGGLKAVKDAALGEGDAAGVVAGGFVDAATAGGVNATFGGGAVSPAAASSSSSVVSNARTTNVSAPIDIKVMAAPGREREAGAAVRESLGDGFGTLLAGAAATGGV